MIHTTCATGTTETSTNSKRAENWLQQSSQLKLVIGDVCPNMASQECVLRQILVQIIEQSGKSPLPFFQ